MSGSSNISGIPSDQLHDIAETIAKTGPDPVMLACVIIFGLIAVGTIVFLIRSYNNQQNKTLEYFQDRSMKREETFTLSLDTQRDEFRAELGEQRKAHISEMERQSMIFEKSLDKVVETHRLGMESLSQQVGSVDDRLAHVEGLITGRMIDRRKQQQTVPVPAVVELPRDIVHPEEEVVQKTTRKRTRRKKEVVQDHDKPESVPAS